MSKYLDNNGMLYLWGKVKSYVLEHMEKYNHGRGFHKADGAV